MSLRLLALVCLLTAGVTGAQAQEGDGQIAYYNRITTGILAGGQHGLVTGSLTTIHGVSRSPWALGAGVGIEGYERWRTVPIFGSLSYHFRGAGEKGLFLQLNAGHAICRLLTANEGIHVDGTRGGPMISSVAGYQIAAGKLLVNISAGYKMQKMSGTYWGPWDPFRYTINEHAERFIFQIGVGL